MSYTDVPRDVLIDTLLPLPYYELEQVCKTNKQTAKICNDPTFWNRKALLDFKTPLPSVRGLYLDLAEQRDYCYTGKITKDCVNKAISDDNPDLLAFYFKKAPTRWDKFYQKVIDGDDYDMANFLALMAKHNSTDLFNLTFLSNSEEYNSSTLLRKLLPDAIDFKSLDLIRAILYSYPDIIEDIHSDDVNRLIAFLLSSNSLDIITYLYDNAPDIFTKMAPDTLNNFYTLMLNYSPSTLTNLFDRFPGLAEDLISPNLESLVSLLLSSGSFFTLYDLFSKLSLFNRIISLLLISNSLNHIVLIYNNNPRIFDNLTGDNLNDLYTRMQNTDPATVIDLFTRFPKLSGMLTPSNFNSLLDLLLSSNAYNTIRTILSISPNQHNQFNSLLTSLLTLNSLPTVLNLYKGVPDIFNNINANNLNTLYTLLASSPATLIDLFTRFPKLSKHLTVANLNSLLLLLLSARSYNILSSILSASPTIISTLSPAQLDNIFSHLLALNFDFSIPLLPYLFSNDCSNLSLLTSYLNRQKLGILIRRVINARSPAHNNFIVCALVYIINTETNLSSVISLLNLLSDPLQAQIYRQLDPETANIIRQYQSLNRPQPPSASRGSYQPPSASRGSYQPPSPYRGSSQAPSPYRGSYQPPRYIRR